MPRESADDAELAFDQREVLAVLAEQQSTRGELSSKVSTVCVGGVAAPRAAARSQFRVRLGMCATRSGLQLPQESRLRRLRRRLACERAEQAVCAGVPSIVTGAICRRSAMHGRMTCTGCRYGRLADDLARMAPGLFEQHVEASADAAGVERGLLCVSISGLQALQALGLHVLAAPGRPCRRPACRGAANI